MFKLLNNEKIIVGYDLGEGYSQISYLVEGSGEAETLSLVAGEEIYNIPTVLCKRTGANQWTYGREAFRCAGEGDGILVENLVGLAVEGETVLIEGTEYDPVKLLTLYVKRSLGLLSQVSSLDRISAMMITAEKMDHRLLDALEQVVEGLHLKTDRVFFQGHAEGFYHYMMRQDRELWSSRALLLEYQKGGLKAYFMDCNRRTRPLVVFVESEDYPPLACESADGGAKTAAELAQMDREFLRLCERLCSPNPVSGVYLIGDGFSETWMKESLRFLCRGRRVFQGNNLYSKGACYGALERLKPGEGEQGCVYLGREKLKSNIGMRILRQGEEIYYALLDAGVNWFEAKHSFTFYLQEGNEVEFVITSLLGGGSRPVRVVLDGLSGELARLRASLYLEAEKSLVVEIEDLGLGVFRPATHRIWREAIGL